MKKSHIALLSAFVSAVVLIIFFIVLARVAVGPSHQWDARKPVGLKSRTDNGSLSNF